MTKPFLIAKWTDVIFLTYAVSESSLADFLPKGLEIDRWDGKPYLSLVALSCSDFATQGIAFPPLKRMSGFPELSLCFPVREKDKRGFVFLRRYIPNPLIATMLKAKVHEPYAVVKMERLVTPDGAGGRIERFSLNRQEREHQLSVSVTGQPPEMAHAETFSPWITEREWVYTGERKARRWRIQHPEWKTHVVSAYEVSLDFAVLFGERWRFLQGRAPDSVLFAEGSLVTLSGSESVI